MELRGYHAKESREDGAETAEFYVRWVSSRTIREAWARRVELMKKSSESTAGNDPPAALDDFEIAIAGRDLSSFDHVRESSLRAKCFLSVNSKPKILPMRVEVARSSNGSVRGLLFHFPRRAADGEPIISTHDAKVWFIEWAGGTEIRVSFNVQTMVDARGLDL